MSKVYLAGPVTGLNYNERNSWRKSAISELAKYGITGISPQRDKTKLAFELDEDDSDLVKALCGEKGLVRRDFHDVQTCDVLLANLLGAQTISIGTMIEYGWANAFNKLIVTVIEKKGNPHEHVFIRELTGYRVETLESGLAVVRSIFNK
ncbi:nucleoside 2-deoxyribosyltransferase [Candidatus Woesearchaeota archaeon]|nr:nucleoside 2-deoxyribosyltransferase [Candidatus Woesearchaeota archaeon]